MNRPLALALLILVASSPARVWAHCDGLDGPVVTAAQRALDSGNVNRVLIWMPKGDESAVRTALAQTVAVRSLGAQARELADRYFFETLVRLHRTSEGAPYTGLKPAGRDLGPAIPAADQALETGNVDPLVTLLTEQVAHGVREHFRAAMAKKGFDQNDVEAGRQYVQTYVPFLHYVEGIYAATQAAAHGHFPEPQEPAAHAD